MSKAPKHINPLPFPVYYWTVALIALAGLGDAIYLAVSHYRVYTDMGYKSFCAVSKALNCDTVSQSSFAIFLQLPVAVWGIVGYLLFLMILLLVWKLDEKKIRLWASLWMMAFCFSVYSIVLALISTFYIHSYCIMCIASYAVNFLLLYFTWLTQRRFSNGSVVTGLRNDMRWLKVHKKAGIVSFSVVALILILLIILFPSYWDFTPHTPEKGMPTGITEDGHPWIGAEDPQITIIEFTDYRCFQCKKMHFYLRELISNHPGKIRLIHRHFPMDHAYNPLVKEPFHVGAGKMALFSLYAAEENKFWEFNDMLFNVDTREGHFNLRGMAKNAGFNVKNLAGAVNDKHLLHKLRIDIRDGLKLGITGTPGYLIDGQVYVGNIPTNIIKAVRQ